MDELRNTPHLSHLAKFYNLHKSTHELPIISDAHWRETYLVNDIMIPTTRNNSILSIFSLEYIDLASTDLTTDITKIENNTQIDSIMNDDFWNYNCKKDSANNKPAHYEWLCTEWEFQNDGFGCTDDFQNRTSCSTRINSLTGCTEKFAIAKGNCRNTRDHKKEFNFEKYGDRSRCFNLNPNHGSACLAFEIVNEKEIHINIQGNTIICKPGVSKIDFVYSEDGKRYSESLRCPDFYKFKKQFKNTSCPYNCNFNGICVEGVCECYAGWNANDNCGSRLNNSTGLYSTFFIEV